MAVPQICHTRPPRTSNREIGGRALTSDAIPNGSKAAPASTSNKAPRHVFLPISESRFLLFHTRNPTIGGIRSP